MAEADNVLVGTQQAAGGSQAPPDFVQEALEKREKLLHRESEEETVLRGRIVTGMPLSVAAQKRVAKRLQEILGKRVKLTCRLDKKQLAGIRVELNGYSYDGTLRGQLQDLQKRLTRPDEEER